MAHHWIKTRKTLRFFLKRFLKYLPVLAILLAMIVPLYYTSYALARQLTMNQSNAKLQEGVDALESQVLRAQEISNLLRQEDAFKRLFFLNGTPSSDYYVDFNTVQIKLKSLSLTQDLFTNVYVMFRDNPVLISNSISSDNYADVYARYYHYTDLTVEEWHNLLFKDSYNVKFLPAHEVYSSYYQREAFEAVTVMLSNSYYYAFDQKSVFVIDFDKRDILNLLLYDEQFGDHMAYITDSENQVIFSHQGEVDQPLEQVHTRQTYTYAGQTYMALTYDSEQLGLHAVIGIPLGVFERNVNALLNLVVLYMIAGVLIIAGLVLFMTVKETLWLKKMVEGASLVTPSPYPIRNEYRYIDHAFTKIRTLNAEQLGRIESLNRSIQHSVLKNMLILGVYTEREIGEVEHYFQGKFTSFCVAKLRYRLDPQESDAQMLEPDIGLTLEQEICALAADEVTAIHMHATETAFVFFFPEEESAPIARLKEQVARVIRTFTEQLPYAFAVNIGLSSLGSDLKQAKTAYQQASYALSSHENEWSSGVYRFEPAPEQDGPSGYDPAILLKLHEAILAGEKKPVLQLFTDSQSEMARFAQMERLQFYFCFRQTVFSASRVILQEKKGAAPLALTLPGYDPADEIVELFGALRESALLLCEAVVQNKRSNNEKLKSDMLTYIEANHADLALNASRIAAALFISEKYVFAFVKEQTGKSLGKFIEEVRLDHAEELLLTTDYAISKVWGLCGFGSENTFYRVFNKRHAVSPSAWRDNRRNLTR